MEIVSFSFTQWTILALCALLTGISKTGVPGMGILCVPLMALTFPAKMSTGLLLPMLAFADIAAVFYYRRHGNCKLVLRLMPWALAGILAASIIMPFVSDAVLQPAIGFIVLVMLALNFWRTRSANAFFEKLPHHWAFSVLMGFFAGLTTQLANAAGPVMAIYLLSMKLPKNEFIGTGAWYFLILNWLKIPLFMADGRISSSTLAYDFMLIPVILTGAVAGIVLLNKIPQKSFEKVVQFLAAAAALKLASSVYRLL